MLKVLSRKTNQTIFMTMSSQVIELVISFLRNILLVRYVGLELFGKYQYLIAVLVMMDFGYAALDSIIRRFFSQSSNEQKRVILWCNLAIKCLLYFISSIIFILYIHYQQSRLLLDYEYLFYYLIIYFFFANILNTLTALAQSFEYYSILNKLNVVLSILAFFVFVFVYSTHWLLPDEFLFFYLLVNGMIIFSKLIYIYVFLYKRNRNIYFFPKCELKFFFTEGIWHYRSYMFPLIMGNFSGYIVNFIPLVILGSRGQFYDVSYLEIIKKIFRFIHKIVPSTVKTMLPTIVVRREQKDFSRKWMAYTASYVGFAIASGLLLFIWAGPIMSIYKVDINSTIVFLFFLYTFYLSIGAWSQSIEFLIFSGTSTFPVFINSLFRQILAIMGFIFVASDATPANLAMVTVGSVFASIGTNIYWLYKYQKNLIFIQLYGLVLILAQLLLMWTLLRFNVYFQWKIDITFLRSVF